jgi:hypothetical protein
MVHHGALVKTDVSEERSASIIRIFFRSVRRLLVNANIVPSLLIVATLMMEALRFSETSVHTGATQRNIPADCILLQEKSNVLSLLDCVSDSLMKSRYC